jgi:hypothetical protein
MFSSVIARILQNQRAGMLQKSPVTYKVSLLADALHSKSRQKKARTKVAALNKPPWGEVEER